MNIGIVYYSRSGNTKIVAEKLQEKFKENKAKVDLIEIKHDKRPGFIKAGRAGLNQMELPIINTDFNLDKYDTILVGSPTWAGKSSPYIKTFFNKVKNIKDKKAAVFFTSSGEPAKAETGIVLKEYLESIGLKPESQVLGLRTKKGEIRQGQENIDDFVKAII